MNDRETAAAVERGKAHFMHTLGNLPEPSRAMSAECVAERKGTIDPVRRLLPEI